MADHPSHSSHQGSFRNLLSRGWGNSTTTPDPVPVDHHASILTTSPSPVATSVPSQPDDNRVSNSGSTLAQIIRQRTRLLVVPDADAGSTTSDDQNPSVSRLGLDEQAGMVGRSTASSVPRGTLLRTPPPILAPVQPIVPIVVPPIGETQAANPEPPETRESRQTLAELLRQESGLDADAGEREVPNAPTPAHDPAPAVSSDTELVEPMDQRSRRVARGDGFSLLPLEDFQL